jgi:DNA-binding CsgD family transcriptional regulator
MEKQELERYLAEGLSLNEIGKRVDRSPSTISYHLKKCRLRPVNQGKHANKGGICEEVLEILVEDGVTLQEMADQLGRSVATVRYWLKRYGLEETAGSRRRKEAAAARKAGLERPVLECAHHGRTEFILENRGSYRCLRCRQERVAEWRRSVKRRLVAEAGGACAMCGYDKCVAALHFHHLDPSQKEFALSRQGVTRSFASAQAEAKKCLLLCSNCHAEVEAGLHAVRN